MITTQIAACSIIINSLLGRMPDWDEAAMQEAIELVSSGRETASQVSRSFGIPRSTLRWRLKEAGSDESKSVLAVGIRRETTTLLS